MKLITRKEITFAPERGVINMLIRMANRRNLRYQERMEALQISSDKMMMHDL
jgi:hypothetical protein